MLNISSLDNKIIKNYLKLKTKKTRQIMGLFLAYGMHQYQEITDKSIIKEVISTDPKIATILVTPTIIKAFAQTITPIDPVLVIQKQNSFNYENKILVLDNISNPDNLGGIIRSMVAFNVYSLIISPTSCEPYNEKVIRASQGGIFKINFKITPLEVELAHLKQKGYHIIGTFPWQKGLTSSTNSFTKEKIALIIGSEAQGINPALYPLINERMSIKTYHLESLNANVAASIMLYEWSKYGN